MKRKQVIEQLEQFQQKLLPSLSEHEVANGWTPQAQQAILKLLDETKQLLREKKPLSPISIGRGLDHWGVVEGEFFESACSLSNNLRAIGD